MTPIRWIVKCLFTTLLWLYLLLVTAFRPVLLLVGALQTRTKLKRAYRLAPRSDELIALLRQVEGLMQEAQYEYHARLTGELLGLVRTGDYAGFVVAVNSVDVRGGSGSLWDVGFADPSLQSRWDENQARLQKLLRETGVA